MIDQEEEAYKTLLNKKFDLFRRLIHGTTEHEFEAARINIEQARRIAMYMHQTYFRHLRLYDFVLKNTKLSEVKRVYIPVAEPKSGDELTKAMVLADDSAKVPGRDLGAALMAKTDPQFGSAAAAGGTSAGNHGSDPQMSLDGTVAKDGHTVGQSEREGESQTDSDMDEVVKNSTINRKGRNVINRAKKEWDNKIQAAVTRSIDSETLPKSGGRKR